MSASQDRRLREMYKLVMLGESVGKTLLIQYRYGSVDLASRPHATIGVDFFATTVNVEGHTVKLQLWDTAGQERFRSLIPSYLRGSQIAVVVYDITDARTFHETVKLIEIVRAERGSDVTVLLVGNKTDLSHNRQVTTEDGEIKAVELGAMFLETSARTGHNVKKLFQEVATAAHKKEMNEKEATGAASGVNLHEPSPDVSSAESGCAC